MNLKYEETEIDGIRFGTTQYGAMRGLELMGRLAQTIGPAFGALSMADETTEMDKFAPVIGLALRDLKPAELSSLVIDILAGTTATVTEGSSVKRYDLLTKESLDRVFSGRLMTMFKVVLHALKVNYSDFGFGSATQTASAPEVK
jgi:hypothetical protein